nr:MULTISPECIES: CrcB family protein [Microbacterium]
MLLAIAGGAIGVAARALLTAPFVDGSHSLVVPAITVAINVAGSFLLGLVVGGFDGRHPHLRVFLGTGVLGGFTTYSAFAVHSVTTFTAAPIVGLLLIVVSIFAGLLAAGVGLVIGRRLAGVPGETLSPEDAE